MLCIGLGRPIHTETSIHLRISAYYTYTMAGLPQYQRVADEESHPLFKSAERTSFEVDLEAVPSVVPAEGSTATGVSRPPRMTYTFNPSYPVPGERRDALGILAYSRQVSLHQEPHAGIVDKCHSKLSRPSAEVSPR
jgi:hypothetical protein